MDDLTLTALERLARDFLTKREGAAAELQEKAAGGDAFVTGLALGRYYAYAHAHGQLVGITDTIRIEQALVR